MRESRNTSESHILSGQAGQKTSFRLLRFFSLISLVSIIATSIILSSWLGKVSFDNLLKGEERANVALSQILANSVWPRFNAFFARASRMQPDEIRQHPTTTELDQFLNRQVANLNIYKIKIFDMDGYTLYSSDFSQIGSSKIGHDSYTRARQGEVASKLSFRDKIYARKELVHDRNVISSYLPVRLENVSGIVGVIEVYKDVTPIFEKIDSTNKKITTGVVAILGVLFFVLYFVVKRADSIIQQQSQTQKAAAEKMRNIALYDSLTGLPNRILFHERLAHAMRLADKNNNLIVLMFIDLDRFKQINDNFGHDAGDHLLAQVAERFRGCVRTGDTVSRISGDEFTIIIEGLGNIEMATLLAQRIITALEDPVKIGEHEIYVTCSIGLSVYPFGDDDMDSLIKKADAAMYFSKTYGRNSYHYYVPEMVQHTGARIALETELNNALQRNEFTLFFQPKINLNDLKMYGMEALLRWNHPERGIVAPDEFIPVLEETGMILQVGEWVIQESCRLVKSWQQQGLINLCVAVNVSALQFRQPGFYQIVESALRDTGLEAEYLELELTESCLLDDLNDNYELFNQLKQLGVKLTIDDFGIGYSSLNYLTKLPVDILKIDRSFIRELLADKRNRSIATAIISFAHSLDIDVVAEGVEDVQQLTFVSAMRCTAVQGYLMSPPIPAEVFYELHESGGDFSYVVKKQERVS